MPMAPDGGPRVAVSLSDASASNDAGFGTGLSGGSGEGTIGLGNIGTIGRHSAGHGGSWATSTGAGHGPIIRTGVPVVRGGLSIETVRRVVRRHLPEVQYCYEAALTQYPDMEGRVTVQFDLSPSGAVVTSGVVQSTLANASVETCLARAARRWVFPSPAGGGVVRVSYPFVLRPYE